MAHCVIGIISSSLAVSRILQSAPGLVAIPLVDGLSLIPLDEDALDAVASDYSQIATGFICLSPSLAAFLAVHSLHAALVYYETDYSGGDGIQAAVAYRDGHSLSPTPCSGDGAINRALGCLGVVQNGAFYEFKYVIPCKITTKSFCSMDCES